MTVVRRAATLSLAIVAAGCGSDLLAPESDPTALSMSVATNTACEGFTAASPDSSLAVGQEVQLFMAAPSGAPSPSLVGEAINPILRLPDEPLTVSGKQAAEVAATRSSARPASTIRTVSLQGSSAGARPLRRPATVRATWTSLDPAIATVTPEGRARGVADGRVIVVARCQRGADSLELTVGRGTVIQPSPTPTPTPTPTPPPPAPAPGTYPATRAEMPRDLLPMPSFPAPTRTIRVPAGGDLQSALNSAEYGDEIVLDAGATYRGSFVLPRKSGTGWITIRSSGALPASGTRVSPANAPAMAKLVPGHWVESAINTAEGAHHYRIVGIEVTYGSEMTSGSNLLQLGRADRGTQLTLASVPTDIVLDRMYIHGNDNVSFYRCLALNSARTIVVDSYISECHGVAVQSQAIAGWNGPGPFRIENNYLEASSQSVFFGGNDPSIADLTPSDIVIRRNHFFTPREWAGRYVIFAQLEFKNAARVLVEGNVFDGEGHQVYSQLWKSVNQSGGAPWSVTKDVTFRHNLIRNIMGGFNIAGKPEQYAAVPAHRITVEHNVLENVGNVNVMVAETNDVILANNSWSGGVTGVVFNGPAMSRFTFASNVMAVSGAGARSDFGFGQVAVERHTATDRMTAPNAFVGGSPNDAPTGSTIFGALAEVPSTFGANRSAVLQATTGVVRR